MCEDWFYCDKSGGGGGRAGGAAGVTGGAGSGRRRNVAELGVRMARLAAAGQGSRAAEALRRYGPYAGGRSLLRGAGLAA
jgi:hypothetical protein